MPEILSDFTFKVNEKMHLPVLMSDLFCHSLNTQTHVQSHFLVYPTRRKNSRLVSMFKILNELVEIPINDRLIPADRRTRGGHNQAYKHL